MRSATLLLILVGWATTAQAQRETVTLKPEYQGHKAHAPIPPEMHIKNEGGSDGAGLCVISSILANGHFQGVPTLDEGKRSQLWTTAKGRPGGYSPSKLAALADEVLPDEQWAYYVGTDPRVLHELSDMGYAIGATMNTGELYNWQPIHHMISLVSYDSDGWACVVDNNDPGKYHWMSAAEFNRRWIDGGAGWAWVWTRLPPTISRAPFAVILAALGALGGILYVVFRLNRQAQS